MTKYIIISGIDGSGKTTVINMLKEELEKKGYTVDYIWMRYSHYSLKIMNALARLLGLSVKVHNKMGNIWEHRLYKKKWFCKLYVWCSFFDNIIAKRKVTKLKSNFIICDRWINDILIDLGAECRFDNILESKWYKKFHSIIPSNSYQFVIIRDRQAVIDCRIENQVNPDFPYRYSLYQKLLKKENIYVIDNSGTIKNSVQQIISVII